MRFGKSGRRPGISLVELLVSVLIVSLGLVALSQLFVSALWTYQKAHYLSIATQQAQYEMEKVRDLGVLRLMNGVDTTAYPPAVYTANGTNNGVTFQVPTLPGGAGSVLWTPYPAGATNNQYLQQVVIAITWTGARRAKSVVNVTTLVTNTK